ncbi:50S ribosomal protein L5 [Candidatus Woesebacteria bacterium RIFCSPHIGHO2_01_FULL_38_10]|uniref:Large ribosomal subunit protein uL5 n=1 Tax=Candidatus Woesebacteria bacterium RIFCSPLOWO2_01_FULL_39_10b TaxID=1802517 RepID=A0A1F8B4J8_9BACT|nr:MAG: 50S ribosomal protein L5 [Candidatus Woesebacteria bacterium RIFCSPHIGHO2_01_FULL_38_10]OGM58931.1 MAG: 50S ribosomal protein L5 [Candidatus Woesebacteria bacterium RIFCSPLOWO2_01_FULL_39_10b]
MNRLKEKYEKEVALKLSREYSISNKMALPRLAKVVVNMGVGDGAKDKDVLEQAKRDLSAITGQLSSERKAKVSVASFGIRQGVPVGLKLTLRGNRMYFFLDKLFSIVLPRLRDFRGVSLKSFDREGNYTLGIEDDTVFPEIDLSKSKGRGLEISMVVSGTKDPEKSRRLLELLGMPFEKQDKRAGELGSKSS